MRNAGSCGDSACRGPCAGRRRPPHQYLSRRDSFRALPAEHADLTAIRICGGAAYIYRLPTEFHRTDSGHYDCVGVVPRSSLATARLGSIRNPGFDGLDAWKIGTIENGEAGVIIT